MKHFLIIFLLLQNLLHAAEISEEKLVSNYIYNFSSYTSWPNGIKNKKFEIYLLSSNKKLASTFKKLIKGQKLHNKEIQIIRSTSSSIPFGANVVYIDTKYLKEYKGVYEQVDGRPVLLVTNSYDNKRLVMINLNKAKDKKVHFEINKANILNQGLSINPKIILLGGTELDVAKLYKDAKDTLLAKEHELQSQIKIAKRLSTEIASSKTLNAELKKEIGKKSKDLKYMQKNISKLRVDQKKLETSITNVSSEVQKQKETLIKEKASTKKIRNDYKKANEELDKMSSKLFSQEKKVQEKESKLSTLTQKVEQKAIEFLELQKNLKNQNVQIQDQGKIIATQKDFLVVLGMAAFVFLILVLIIFITLRREHRTNDELKKTQTALEEQVEATKLANDSKTKFLAHMSHELRTPLNAVLGYSQLLQKDTQMSEENQTILATINRSGEHLLSLINDVLEISKIETGKISLDPISFDFHQFLDDIYTMFAERMSSEGLNLELLKDRDVPQFIYADINKIRQIFINIIGNSIRFTSKGGVSIRVGNNKKESILLVQIEDSGEGISEDEMNKLFQPFSQTISGKLGGGGAGLGLSIVQEYIELMEGSVEVKSKPAFGTTFNLSIPYIEAKGSIHAHNDIIEVKSLKDEDMGMEVLIADDSTTNNDLMIRTLSRVGFKVTAVENGFEALRLFKLMRHKLILLDIEMPVMDGYTAVKEIKALEYGKDTPVVAVTASVFGIEKGKAERAGFDALVRKPFTDYKLFEQIEKVLDIEFLYEDQKTRPKVEKVSLTALDESYKSSLIKAASRMRITEINSLIAGIEDTFPNEAKYMKKLALKFDYETLIELLKQ